MDIFALISQKQRSDTLVEMHYHLTICPTPSSMFVLWSAGLARVS